MIDGASQDPDAGRHARPREILHEPDDTPAAARRPFRIAVPDATSRYPRASDALSLA